MEKPRILVVDDDETVVEYLETSLVISGYDVATAQTGTEAIGRLRAASEPFPLALIDIMMPGIDGIELLKLVRKNYPETRVIMMTAFSSADSAIQALNAGAFAYLRKPVNLDELVATLKNAYETYTLTRENARLLEELKRATEYNEAIIENLVYLIVATDTNGTIRKINKAMETLLGYRDEEVIGFPLQMLFTPEFQYSSWNEMVKANRVTDFPVTFRAKNGREIALHFTGTIMKSSEGQFIGFLGTAAKV
jgi:PAS domain S-box-containing protein